MSADPAPLPDTIRALLSQAYAQRRPAEGKTDREIRRCIKRYLARHLYRTLSQGILSST